MMDLNWLLKKKGGKKNPRPRNGGGFARMDLKVLNLKQQSTRQKIN